MSGGSRAGFAGRTAERELLRTTLDAAARGSAGLVVVSGEAGIGKTRLVTEAVRDATGRTVLWGRCVQLATLAMPYQPFVNALEGWYGSAAVGSRERLLRAAPGLREALPSLGAGGPPGSSGVPATFMRALEHLAVEEPTVLVVDDAQWADAASLDVLAYAVAGLRSQRLAILLTLRNDQLPDGDRLHGWLADVRRLPCVTELELPRMGAEDTAEQLRALLGRAPQVELVEEVLLRSEGNPYFTELLAREVDPATGRLHEGLPDALRTALLAAWHRLPRPAREVTRLLAVSGHPVEDDVLLAAAGRIGMDPTTTAEALHTASDAGVLVLDRSRLWFRHPLLAEVLLQGLLPFARVAAHRALVEALTGGSVPPRPADLARHYEGAQLFDQALQASLRAADGAAALEARDEEAELRLRAARLWPRASGTGRSTAGPQTRLWADAAESMVRAGDTRAFEVLQGARQLLAANGAARVEGQPGDTAHARLLRYWAILSRSHGQPVEATRVALARALELCADHPDAAEHAYLLAELSDLDHGAGRTEDARSKAQEAVDAARRSGDAAAICWALGVRVNNCADAAAAEADLREALRTAVRAGLPHAEAVTRQVYASFLHDQGWTEDAAEQLLRSRAVALEHGLATVAQLSGADAVLLLCDQGRLAEAKALLPGVLTGRSSGWGGIEARDAALRLSLRAGGEDVDGDARRLQLRAPDGAEIPGLLVAATRAEYLVGAGRSDEALELLESSVPDHARVSGAMGRELLVWSARAAGALAVRQQAATDRFTTLLAGVEKVLPPPRFAVETVWQTVVDAEVARLLGHESPERWLTAVEALDRAGLRFERARCRLSLARCLLGTPARDAAAAALRKAHEEVRAMGAVGLAAEAEQLARAARIPLARPSVAQQPDQDGAGRGLLTRREREVLGHVAAGRTYAEIARSLFISEKTVSVHVSNLLRKTGTGNRVELALWAQAAGQPKGR